MKSISSWHVGVAAEAYAAAVFARYGYDVSVQYGANQPEYDLISVCGDKMLKISVKGSQDGGWGLTQNYKKAVIIMRLLINGLVHIIRKLYSA